MGESKEETLKFECDDAFYNITDGIEIELMKTGSVSNFHTKIQVQDAFTRLRLVYNELDLSDRCDFLARLKPWGVTGKPVSKVGFFTKVAAPLLLAGGALGAGAVHVFSDDEPQQQKQRLESAIPQEMKEPSAMPDLLQDIVPGG